MRKLVLVSLLIVVLALAGCRGAGSTTPTPTQAEPAKTAEVQEAQPTQPQVQATDSQAYPYPSPQAFMTRTPRTYPEPQNNVAISTATPIVVPTAGKDTGVVTGVLINTETGEPMAYQSVYLGMRIYLTPGPGYTYALQEASSPHAITAEDGEFAIGDVPPGDYILMIFTPFGASVVMQPNTDRELDVKVAAGQVLDVGTLEAVQPELR
jgi:nitrous oxide reductase accessory protein NosL